MKFRRKIQFPSLAGPVEPPASVALDLARQVAAAGAGDPPDANELQAATKAYSDALALHRADPKSRSLAAKLVYRQAKPELPTPQARALAKKLLASQLGCSSVEHAFASKERRRAELPDDGALATARAQLDALHLAQDQKMTELAEERAALNAERSALAVEKATWHSLQEANRKAASERLAALSRKVSGPVALTLSGRTFRVPRAAILEEPDSLLATLLGNESAEGFGLKPLLPTDDLSMIPEEVVDFFEDICCFYRHRPMALCTPGAREGVLRAADFFGMLRLTEHVKTIDRKERKQQVHQDLLGRRKDLHLALSAQIEISDFLFKSSGRLLASGPMYVSGFRGLRACLISDERNFTEAWFKNIEELQCIKTELDSGAFIYHSFDDLRPKLSDLISAIDRAEELHPAP